MYIRACTSWIWILLYAAFCTIMAISRQKEARSRDYALLLFRITSRVLYSAQYHMQHCALHAFEQFGALYMHNQNDKYPSRPGFEPGSPRYKPQSVRMSHQGRPCTSCGEHDITMNMVAFCTDNDRRISVLLLWKISKVFWRTMSLVALNTRGIWTFCNIVFIRSRIHFFYAPIR